MAGGRPAIRPMHALAPERHVGGMSDTQSSPETAFSSLSDALVRVVAGASPHVAGLAWGRRGGLSAILWRQGVLVTSEQSLPEAEHYQATLPGGGHARATLAGRDPSTNVAVLRVEADAAPFAVAEPAGVGALVLALGGDSARMGSIEALGPAWESQRGGRIDRLVRLAVRLPQDAEGGPVVDAHGRLLGMSTYGPRRGVLVIPAATVARSVEPLLRDGRLARGWLGVGLHEVALPPEITQRASAMGGLMVMGFADGAPAAGALLPGDILVAVAGTPVVTVRALARMLGPEAVGQALELTLVRGGALTRVAVTIGARP